jgi:hypothetical protein
VKHGSFVLLAFADEYEPVDRDASEGVPQSDDGDVVDLVLVPRAHEAHSREGCTSGGAGETLEDIGGKAG